MAITIQAVYRSTVTHRREHIGNHVVYLIPFDDEHGERHMATIRPDVITREGGVCIAKQNDITFSWKESDEEPTARFEW